MTNVDKVDLLFVIDDSSSMKDNQDKLREQIPRLVRKLVSGSGATDDSRSFAPARDVHFAVVNADMGASGAQACSEHGADGVLQHASRGPACAATYPPFLSYLAVPDADVDALSRDVACIADVGTSGCGQQQPLEAALKALWPASDPLVQFERGPSHADRENAGFSRSDPTQGASLLAIVVLSDEDDASPFPLSRYFGDGLRALRPGNQALSVFSAIVTVPPELVDSAARSGVDFTDAQQRDAYYEHILSDPRMQPVSDGTSERGQGSPGRRYVELAKELGESATLTSIEQDDFSPALSPITNILDRGLDSICLPEAMPRDERGTVACSVIWELPSERINFDTPIDCSDRPQLLSDLPATSASEGKRCLVKQQPANEAPTRGEGWYYDSASAALAQSCPASEPQRVVFTRGAQPPTGVTVTVRCRSQAPRAVCE